MVVVVVVEGQVDLSIVAEPSIVVVLVVVIVPNRWQAFVCSFLQMLVRKLLYT